MINNLNGLYSDNKEDASIKLAQLSQFYQQHSHLLGQTNDEIQSPKQNNPFNYQFNRTSPINGTSLNSINNNSPKSNNIQQQNQTIQVKGDSNVLIVNCGNDESNIRTNSNQSINNVSNNSSSSGTSGKSSAKSTTTPNPWTEKLKPKCNCIEMQKTECHLETKELWDKFNELGTEMIITKTGRYVSFNFCSAIFNYY